MNKGKTIAYIGSIFACTITAVVLARLEASRRKEEEQELKEVNESIEKMLKDFNEDAKVKFNTTIKD